MMTPLPQENHTSDDSSISLAHREAEPLLSDPAGSEAPYQPR